MATVSPKDFRKLKVTEMEQTGLSFIIGKRGTGKTRLVCDLAYNWYLHGMKCKRKLPDGTDEFYMRPLDLVICFSPTELLKEDFKVFVPSAYRYPKFRENVVHDLVARQKACIEKHGDEKCQRVLMIIDDCAFEKGFFKTETMRFIAMNLRHYNVHVIITVQYALDVPPAIRQNLDYCFCLHDNSNSNKKRYWEHFYGQIATQRDFNNIFEALTNNYSCMVGCNGVQSSTLTDTLFWYKGDVKLPAEFRLGRPAYWLLSSTTQIDKTASAREPPKIRALEDAPKTSRASSGVAANRDAANRNDAANRDAANLDVRRQQVAPPSSSHSSGSSSSRPHALSLSRPISNSRPNSRANSRTPFQHSDSSMVRRNHSSLPVEIVVV